MLASLLPDTRLLRALIARGVDLNRRHAGLTPLLAATRDSLRGRPDAVMTLLANGADPRAADHDGNTPLHHAARSSDPGVAALLRDASADLDVQNAGDSYPPTLSASSVIAGGSVTLNYRLSNWGPDSAPPSTVAVAASDCCWVCSSAMDVFLSG